MAVDPITAKILAQLAVVEGFQKDYVYQSLGIYEQDYIDADGANYEGIIFSDCSTEVVYFNQLDEIWKDTTYGSDKIGSHGNGPTAMSIVVSSLAGETVDPPHMAQLSVDNGGYCAGNGSYHKLITL